MPALARVGRVFRCARFCVLGIGVNLAVLENIGVLLLLLLLRSLFCLHPSLFAAWSGVEAFAVVG